MVKKILNFALLIALCGLICGASSSASDAASGKLEELATISFTESPTVDAEGNVYFTDIRAQRIYKYSQKKVTVFRENSNGANGIIFDDQWRLIVCESNMEKPRVTRTDMKTGKTEVLVEGGALKTPNDVTLDGKGRIYFTDPEGKAIYRIDKDGKMSKILSAPLMEIPNGIVISPDDRTLYQVESNNKEGGARVIRAYDLAADGTVSNMRIFHNYYPGRSADGIAIDSKGNLYAAAGLNRTRGTHETLDTKPGIYVYSPDGKQINYYPTWEDTVTNCAFGGPDMKTLYVTAGKTLFSIQVDIEGTRR